MDNQRYRTRAHRGATLPEVVLSCIVIVALAAMLAVLSGESRRTAMLSEDLGKLRQIAALTSHYTADHGERYPHFSWKEGKTPSLYPDLKSAPTNSIACNYQMIDILRRLADREDMNAPGFFFSNINFGHLPLVDYAGMTFPSRLFISSADANRLLWATDPKGGFDKGKYGVNQPTPNSDNKRWPYSASFVQGLAVFAEHSGPNVPTNATTHSTWNIPNLAPLGGHLASEVAHPSQKVIVHDAYGRHHGSRIAYFAYEEARVPAMMADASARVVSKANPGWHPLMPTKPGSMQFKYEPLTYEPAKLSGISDVLVGRIRYTRQALLGRDVDGPEVP